MLLNSSGLFLLKSVAKMATSIDVPYIDRISVFLASCRHLLNYNAISSLISLFYLLCAGSLFFDVVHHMLHRCEKSSHPLFKRLARIHHYHHLYFTRHLQFDKKYLRQNQFQALPLELALQIFGTILGYTFSTLVTPTPLVWTKPNHVWYIIGFQVTRTAFVIATSGRDSNHLVYQTAPKDPNWIFVGPEFHSLHHVYPDRYIGSFIKALDWICGTAYSFRGKRFVITGANEKFGQAIVAELEREGVNGIHKLDIGTDWNHDDFENAIPLLSNSDVLILAHSLKGQDEVESNCKSAIRLIKLFKKHKVINRVGPTLPEVWYVGNESEVHLSWGNRRTLRCSQQERGFLPHARYFYDDPNILYRHIVPSSFCSIMKFGVQSTAVQEARFAMWWIRRGARYVTGLYIGAAYLNYLRFIFSSPYAQDEEEVPK